MAATIAALGHRTVDEDVDVARDASISAADRVGVGLLSTTSAIVTVTPLAAAPAVGRR